ncbi:hypothetical protein M0P98_00030 [bacterium]|nr:hypothetical protein [bacterium]
MFYFFLSAILIYSASLLGSLLFKNFFPSILGVPFFLLLIGLVFSPFFVFLFLLAPSLHIFFILLFSSTIGLFLTLSFVIWQKESVSDTGAVKKSLKILVSIFVISLFMHGICNLVSEVELRKSIEQAKSLGLKLRIEEIIPPAVPDEKNGAVVYEEAFTLVDSLQKRYKEEWEYVFPTSKYIPISNVGQLLEESTLEEKNRLSRIVEDPEFILLYKLVEKAVKMPECRFDVEYQAGVDMSHTQIVKMGEAAKIVAVKTGLLVSEGRFQESLDSAILLWKMGDSFANEPLLISQASRTQIKQVSIYNIKKIFETTTLVKIPQEQMDELIKISKDKEMELFLNGFIKGDTTVYLSLFSSTKDRLDGYYFEDVLPFPFYGSYLLRPIFKKDQSCYLKFFVKRMELFSEPYFVSINKSKKLDEQFADYKSFKTKKLLFSSMLLTSNRFFLKRQAEHIVNLDTLKLILALKIYHDKHHNYPNSLALLAPNIIPEVPIDPFTGKDYIYRLEGKGFVLDSAGAKKE